MTPTSPPGTHGLIAVLSAETLKQENQEKVPNKECHINWSTSNAYTGTDEMLLLSNIQFTIRKLKSSFWF